MPSSDTKGMKPEHIIKLAMDKLIGPYLCVEIVPQSEYAPDLIANNMCLCIKVLENCKYIITSMPSKPVLAKASAQIMNDLHISLTELINKLSEALKKGLVEAGYHGELTAMLLLLNKIKNRLEETVKFTGRKFSEAYIKFTHFINITYTLKRKDLGDALIHGTLDEKFNENQILYILIQIKNHATNNKGIEDLPYMPFLSLYLQLDAKSELVDILSKFTETPNMISCKYKITEVLEDYKIDTKETKKNLLRRLDLKIKKIQSIPVSIASSSAKVSNLTNSLKHLLSAWVEPVIGEGQETMKIVKHLTPKIYKMEE
ncbi:22304_t:CDS:2 [Cetraspora pellucida]|uniref:22304_t:CDS:1 n=1 Tax=Cetraspora pellucida TaxID=1433469 RepID=A0A9N9I8T2_9GLOM|nr:22304_t:CDS:2 [Cetraspora pellucida]